MDNDANTPLDRLGTALNVICVAAGAAALFAPGFAIIGGIVAVLSLAGSVAIAVTPRESDCERFLRECSVPAVIPAAEEPQASQQPAQVEGKQWAASVAASKVARRGR